MTSLALHPTYNATSAAGAMIVLRACEPIVVGCMLVGSGTSTAYAPPPNTVFRSQRSVDRTTAGAAVSPAPSTGAAVSELRRLSGLTWDQLAQVFDVSRRSLHFWASGKSMSPANEDLLLRVLAVVRTFDRGSASANRAALLGVREDGSRPLDLLVAGHHDRVLSLLGPGMARPAVPVRPSAEVLAARAPRAPDELVDAIPDGVHRGTGVYRVAKSVRVRSGR